MKKSKWQSGDALVEQAWKKKGGLQDLADEIDRLHKVIDDLERRLIAAKKKRMGLK